MKYEYERFEPWEATAEGVKYSELKLPYETY